jgi:hypothetical protein
MHRIGCFVPILLVVALLLVLLSGCYLAGLAVLSFLSPERASRFLLGFAGSASAHYLELVVRLFIGGAILHSAPHVLFSRAFVVAGWVLVVTTLGLFAVPWRWHHRFAQWGVPHAVANLQLVAVASFVLGGFIIASVILGSGVRLLLAAI